MADSNREFYLNYGSCEEWAGKIDGKNQELREKLNDIQKTINSLESGYESDASATIRSKITGMTPRFQNYQDVVKQYTTFIRNAAQQTGNTERSVNNNANQFN